MNRRGQALITFVLLLPLIVLFVGYFINIVTGMMVKNRIDGIVYDNLKVALDNDILDENIIIDAIKANDNDLFVSIIIEEDNIQIEANAEKENPFNIFNKGKYDIQVKYCANYLKKRITKNCG